MNARAAAVGFDRIAGPLAAPPCCCPCRRVSAPSPASGGDRPLERRPHAVGQGAPRRWRVGGPRRCGRAGRSSVRAAWSPRFCPDEVPYPEPEPHRGRRPPGRADAGRARSATSSRPRPSGTASSPRLVRGGDPGRVELRTARALAQGRDGADAADARTARQYAVANPYDPRSNIEAGARHLQSLLDRFDVSRALAAYNAGEGAVRRFGGIPPYPETRDYVRADSPPRRCRALTTRAVCPLPPV